MFTCEYVYKYGPKKGEQCGRKSRKQYCFQHAAQVKKENNSNIIEETEKMEEIIEKKVKSAKFIQLTNTPNPFSK